MVANINYLRPVLVMLSLMCFTSTQALSNTRPLISRSTMIMEKKRTKIQPRILTLHAQLGEKEDQSFTDGIFSFKQRFDSVADEGFGTRAKNVASTMSVGDVIVPLCANIPQRQNLANMGIYAGVEYKVCSLTLISDEKGVVDESISTVASVPPNQRDQIIAQVRPAYKLRDHLERMDWPVQVKPLVDVPLWLSKTTYEAGTMLGTLGLSFTYLSIAAILAFFVRFAYVPSPSMQPTLNPGDVVLVTRNIWPWKPSVGDVVLFDPPPQLASKISESAMMAQSQSEEERSSDSLSMSMPTKGQQFLKRVVAREGEMVGVKNSQPIVELPPSSSDESVKRYRVDIVGPYARPELFSDSSWNRSAEILRKNEYFVSGDNGFRSADSRVWGSLDGKYIYGVSRWVIWPIQDFGPVKDGNMFTIEK